MHPTCKFRLSGVAGVPRGSVTPMPTVRVAVFDLGSGSFHLMVVDASRDGVLTPVLRRRSFLHLGTEVARTGGVPADRATTAVRAVRRLRAAADEAEVDVVVALATAALRDADNGPEAARPARAGDRQLDHPVDRRGGGPPLLPRPTGRRLGGQRAGPRARPRGREPRSRHRRRPSRPCGDQRGPGSGPAPGELRTAEGLTPKERSRVVDATRERAEPIRLILAKYPDAADRAIASGGTVRALARLAMVLHRPLPSSTSVSALQVNQVELPAGQLHELADRLVSLDLDARLALPGVQARRAPLLPIGAVLLSTLVETLGLQRLVVSDWGAAGGGDPRRPLPPG